MKRRIITLFVLLFLAIISHAQDQMTSPPDALFTFTIVEEPGEGSDITLLDFRRIEWTPDSLSFRFPYTTPRERLNSYLPRSMQYFVETHELRSELMNGCLMTLTKELSLAANTRDCVKTLSPDGRYAIVPTQEEICGENCSFLLALIDLRMNTHVILDGPVYTYYVIRWSENSQGFLMFAGSATGGGGTIQHAHIPESLETIKTLELTNLKRFQPEYPEFVDMSPDGWQVLVRGDRDSLLDGLTLWDARWPSTHNINQPYAAPRDGRVLTQDQMISGAAFLSNSPNEVLIVLEQGIIRYNIETQEETLINPNIVAREQRWIYFSPDDQYALVYDDGWHNAPLNQEKRTYLSLFRVIPEE